MALTAHQRGFFEAVGDHHRNPQLINIQRTTAQPHLIHAQYLRLRNVTKEEVEQL